MSDLNDPRVFFAAERTLLAWNRTSLTLMGFGFMIERFALVLRMLAPNMDANHNPHGPSFWIGISFITIGAAIALISSLQYRRVLRTFRPIEIPSGYLVNMPVLATLALAVLGVLLAVYLIADIK